MFHASCSLTIAERCSEALRRAPCEATGSLPAAAKSCRRDTALGLSLCPARSTEMPLPCQDPPRLGSWQGPRRSTAATWRSSSPRQVVLGSGISDVPGPSRPPAPSGARAGLRPVPAREAPARQLNVQSERRAGQRGSAPRAAHGTGP